MSDENKKDLIKKYNISDEDLYKLSYISNKQSEVGYFAKESLKAKNLKILKPYKVSFMDLGNLLNVIENENYHKDQSFINQYGEVNLESTGSSFGGKYILTILAGVTFVGLVLFGITNIDMSVGSSSVSSNNVSFREAKTFMKNRCGDIGQTYIDGKSSSLDNTRIYVFLTKGIRHPDFYCVTMITENKLEVLTTDCGKSEKRILFNKL
jgi:hypothetical protein